MLTIMPMNTAIMLQFIYNFINLNNQISIVRLQIVMLKFLPIYDNSALIFDVLCSWENLCLVLYQLDHKSFHKDFLKSFLLCQHYASCQICISRCMIMSNHVCTNYICTQLHMLITILVHMHHVCLPVSRILYHNIEYTSR